MLHSQWAEQRESVQSHIFACVCCCMIGSYGILPQFEGANVDVLDLRHFDLLKWGCANVGVFGAR